MLAISTLLMLLALAALALAMDRHAVYLPPAWAGHRVRRWLQVLGQLQELRPLALLLREQQPQGRRLERLAQQRPCLEWGSLLQRHWPCRPRHGQFLHR